MTKMIIENLGMTYLDHDFVDRDTSVFIKLTYIGKLHQ
jgi:hypothetical protein